jgi:hypothetical protein
MRVSFEIDGVVYYEKSVSVRNPPALCFGVPYLKQGADLCLKLYNITWKNSTYSGCVDLQANLFDVKIAQIKIGCFHFGNHTLSMNKNKSLVCSTISSQAKSLEANKTSKKSRNNHGFFRQIMCSIFETNRRKSNK